MLRPANLGIKVKVGFLGLTLLAGIIVFAAVSYNVISVLQHRQRAIQTSGRVARVGSLCIDWISPPSSMLRVLLAENGAELKAHLGHLQETERSFQERRSQWMNQLHNEPLKSELSQAFDLSDQLTGRIMEQIRKEEADSKASIRSRMRLIFAAMAWLWYRRAWGDVSAAGFFGASGPRWRFSSGSETVILVAGWRSKSTMNWETWSGGSG